MLCQICEQEKNISYSTSYGEICSDCYWKLYDSKKEKKKTEQEIKEMHKRYGLC